MEIINCKQKSDEWFSLREKRVTASHAQAIGNCGRGLDSYIVEKMSAYYSMNEPEQYINNDIARGNELEAEAATIYAFETGEKTKTVGFVIYNDYVGCSPDLFVEHDGLAEIKCPNDKTYFQLLLGAKIDTKYVWQMQMQMLCCDLKWCDFVVYNPNFTKNIIVKRIASDYEMQKKLMDGFCIAEAKIKTIIREMEA